MIFRTWEQVNEYMGSEATRPYPIRGKAATTMHRRAPDRIAVQYHTIDVVTYTPEYMELDSGGHRTITTKNRISASVRGVVLVRGFGWEYRSEFWGHATPFEDHMKVSYDGSTWVNHLERQARMRDAEYRAIVQYLEQDGYYKTDDFVSDEYTEDEWEKQALELRMQHLFADLRDKGEINKVVTLVGIPPAAYNEAREVLEKGFKATLTDGSTYDHSYMARHGIDSQYMQWWLEDRGETKPAKHLEKVLKQRYGIRLNQETKEKIGAILRPVNNKVRVRISKGCAGSSKEYYHEGSCYWGGYAKSRDWIEGSNGGAIRFYTESDEIIGRAWFVPHKNNMVLFNTYGKADLQHTKEQAKYTAMAVDALYKIVEAEFSRSTQSGFYLNSNTVALIGPSTDDNFVKVRLHAPDEFVYANGYTCGICDEYLDEDHMYYIDCEDRYVCHSCLEDNYSYVDNGDYSGYYPSADVVSVRIPTRYGYSWADYYYEDSNIAEVDGEYYLVDDLVCDEYGEYHVLDSDTYQYTKDGKIYPAAECVALADKSIRHIDECTQNTEGVWVLNEQNPT